MIIHSCLLAGNGFFIFTRSLLLKKIAWGEDGNGDGFFFNFFCGGQTEADRRRNLPTRRVPGAGAELFRESAQHMRLLVQQRARHEMNSVPSSRGHS
jgi:hypothetical protein